MKFFIYKILVFPFARYNKSKTREYHNNVGFVFPVIMESRERLDNGKPKGEYMHLVDSEYRLQKVQQSNVVFKGYFKSLITVYRFNYLWRKQKIKRKLFNHD